MGQFYRIVAEEALGATYDSSHPYEPGSLDCSRFTYAVAKRLHPGVDFAPVSKLMHLAFDGALGSFANVDALVDLGVALHETAPGRAGLYYCQGWNGKGGHNFWLHRRKGDRSLWVIEVTNYRRGGVPERKWCRQVTFEEIKDRYPDIRMCRLHPRKL